MHPNRKKISPSKLKIAPRVDKKKKLKSKIESVIPSVIPRVASKKKKIKLQARSFISKHLKINVKDKLKYLPLNKWENLLKGEAAFILGNSPSISEQKLELLDPYLTIGINRIFYIYTPTILIWQDIQMWNTEKKNLIKQKSIKICNKISDPRKLFINFRVREGNYKFGSNAEVLHGMGNTGILAAQIAVNLGCSALVLLGTDCKYGKGKKTDFYGKNKDHKPYTLQMCNEAMEWLKNNCPVPIYNCSENKLWPKQELLRVIKKIKPNKMSMNRYKEIFKK